VVWHGKADGFTAENQVWYNKYTTSWAGPTRISAYAGMQNYPNGAPSIAIDSNDYIHVVFYGTAPGLGYSQIWYNKYITSWAGTIRISGGEEMQDKYQNYPSIAVDASDHVHVLWNGKATGYMDYDKLWRAKYVTSWGDPELLQDMDYELTYANLRWSRYPSSNIPYDGVDYVFTKTAVAPPFYIYWDKKDNPFPPVETTPTVTTDPATVLSPIAATPNGTLADDGALPCVCGFELGLDTGYGITTPPQSKAKGESFSQVIGGLTPNTTYHFRAFATNSLGTSYGADRSFTTALVISRAHALARREL